MLRRAERGQCGFYIHVLVIFLLVQYGECCRRARIDVHLSVFFSLSINVHHSELFQINAKSVFYELEIHL